MALHKHLYIHVVKQSVHAYIQGSANKQMLIPIPGLVLLNLSVLSSVHDPWCMITRSDDMTEIFELVPSKIFILYDK